MKWRILNVALSLTVLLSSGCSAISEFVPTRAITSSPPTPMASLSTTPDLRTPTLAVTETEIPISGPPILHIWLPPELDPNGDTQAAEMLKKRLDEFEQKHPGLELDVRIKDGTADTSLVDVLDVTSEAAPSSLPDLIALQRPDMELAVQEGLLHPLDGLSVTLEDRNWYGYARQLAYIQNIGYGLPFAGDTLVLSYHSEVQRINSWDEVLASENPLVFAAGDPRSLVLLSMYVSGGGTFADTQGRLQLDEAVLRRVLTIFADGLVTGVFSGALPSVTSDEQAIQAYRGKRANMAIYWASKERPTEGQITIPMPGLGEADVIYADGWVWAIAGSRAENQQLAVDLADDLVADDFLGAWTRELGYLPTRISNDYPLDKSLVNALEKAQPLPSAEVLSMVGPILQEALTRVLNGDNPAAVAQHAAEQLK